MKRTISLPPLCIIAILFLLVSCETDNMVPSIVPATPPPVISSFSPTFALPGETVTITGSGFAPTPAGNTVLFANNVAAIVTAASPTQLTVTVPASAVTGTVSVSAGGPYGISPSPFEVLIDIPRNGLVAWYPLNGNANDESGNGFNLTLQGVCNSVADRFGVPGKAYSFGNTSGSLGGEAMSTDVNAAVVAQPVSVGFWVYYNFNSHSVAFVGKHNGTSLGYMCEAANNTLMMRIDKPVYTPPYALSLSGTKWIFVLGTFDGANVKLYINNFLFATIPVSGSITSTAGVMQIYGVVGTIIDDVTVYNHILTDAEMTQLYSATITKR